MRRPGLRFEPGERLVLRPAEPGLAHAELRPLVALGKSLGDDEALLDDDAVDDD